MSFLMIKLLQRHSDDLFTRGWKALRKRVVAWIKTRTEFDDSRISKKKGRWKSWNFFRYYWISRNDSRWEKKWEWVVSFHRDFWNVICCKSCTKRIRWIASLKHQMKPKLKWSHFFQLSQLRHFEAKRRLKASSKWMTSTVTQIVSHLCFAHIGSDCKWNKSKVLC